MNTTPEELDIMEIQSDVFWTLYARMKEKDAASCTKYGGEPLSHRDLCLAVKARIERMD
jgi:hypothetical protein